MKTVQIPRVPFAVSKICLGCAPHGTSVPKPLAHEILDYYYDKGGFFFNTAHEYGDGLSEKCLGEWVRSRGVRDKVIITTKGGEDDRVPGTLTLHREDLVEDMDESLARLGLEYVDFFMLHVDDPNVGIDEILDTLEDLRKAGKMRYYGCSNWSVERQRAAAEYAGAHGYPGFVIDEIEFNLARNNRSNRGECKWLDEDFIALHEEDGVCVGGYSAMASGIFSQYALTGNYDHLVSWRASLFDNPYNREMSVRIKKLSDETGWTAAQIQLAWLTNHPYRFPSFSIIGAMEVAHLEDSLGACDLRLTPDMMDYLRPDFREFPEGQRIE